MLNVDLLHSRSCQKPSKQLIRLVTFSAFAFCSAQPLDLYARPSPIAAQRRDQWFKIPIEKKASSSVLARKQNQAMKATQVSSDEVNEAVSFAVNHGVVVGQSVTAAVGTSLSHAPFTLRPSRVSARCFDTALRITPALNRLIRAIARDTEYVRGVLKETGVADSEFTGRLLAMMGSNDSFETPTDDENDDDIELAICRYDYFIENDNLYMVEMNCIAASFAALGVQTNHLHRYLISHPSFSFADCISPSQLPPNDALNEIARGIAHAHHLFVDRHRARFDKAARCACVMVVQPGERNAYDQYALQQALWQNHGVEMIRQSLRSIADGGELDEKTGLLTLSNVAPTAQSHIVVPSVVYFRAGYAPEDYPSEAEWRARATIEASRCVKVPTVATQLVGTKKIQQVLTHPGQVERFLPNDDDEPHVADIRRTFVQQLSLASSENGADHAQQAIDRPEDFVLKPQREGGGNNLYGQQLKDALLRMPATEREAYILMQRIRPDVVENVIIRGGQHAPAKVVSELGVYGVIVSTSAQDKQLNYAAGTLLRSKSADKDDGGVAAGVAVLDSPCLS